MLLLWAVLVILIAVNGQMAQAAECFKNDGREGRCMDIDSCNVSLKAFDECKLIPDKCDKGVYSPQVCCPVWPVIMERPIEYSCETFGSNRRLIGQAVNNHTRFPHAAALGYLEPNKNLNCYSYKCGGTLIHWRYVLTAAHCITSTGPKVVLMGVSDLRKDELPPYAQRIEVKSVLPHEGFPQDKYKDIALVHLKESIVDTPYVSPACLLTADIIRNGEVTTIGWGKGEQPGLLQEAKLSVVKCAKKTERNHVICARSKIHAACEGDSGGPLLVYHENMQYVVGVYSYGPTFCKKNALGRFLAVTPFLDWIEKIVWPAQHCVYKKHLEQ